MTFPSSFNKKHIISDIPWVQEILEIIKKDQSNKYLHIKTGQDCLKSLGKN